VVEPRPPGAIGRFKEFWTYRALFLTLTRRMVRKMYARTLLGRVWIVLLPTMGLGAQVLFFGGILGVPSGGVPYALFFAIGMTGWIYFQRLVYIGTRSIDISKSILKRMYVPRLTVLASSLGIAGTFFAMFFIVTLIIIGYLWITDGKTYLELGTQTLLAPAGLLLLTMLAFSVAFITAPLAAHWRDIRFMVRFGLNFWTYITPIIYTLDSVPSQFQPIALYNPATAPVEMIKYGLLGSEFEVHTSSLIATAAFLLVIGGGGFWYFTRSEALAVDHL
jgi:lipopolysaccharide transport system permease protein